MISAFGVVHKASAVPGSLEPILPSTTVLAYNNSQRNKKSAAGRNLAAKIGGTAVGIGGGFLAYRGARRLPALKTASKIKLLGRPVKITSEKKQGYALSALTSAGGGIGGYIGGKSSLDRIKRDKKYQYRSSG